MPNPDIRSSILHTDLYQLTMLQGYLEHGMEETAVFEFFVRTMPPQRGFFMAAGLEQLVEFLEQARFTSEELDWVATSGLFSQSFVDYLERWKFSGDLHAIPEGTIFFANEPIARITAPLPQAQLVETRLINLLQYQTLVASKAARCVLASSEKPLIDFGLRRAHGAEAGLLAARASYLAGFSGSATILAESLFGVPVFGTMAHSFIQAHTVESEAFEHFADAHPDNVVLLIDTYNTEEGARKVVALASRVQEKGISIKGVRLDSGDLVDHAFKVRKILDEGGLNDVQITASGHLDEYAIQALVAAQAPIDFLAIGTKLAASADVPYLDCVYKLQEYAGRPTRKKSEGKATWPGPKQVYRQFGQQGRIDHDVITTVDAPQEGEPLIHKVMEAGKRLGSPIPLTQSREHAATQLIHLPQDLCQLREGATVEVQVSQTLRKLAEAVDAQH
ncbi:MAG: nicotinate phosphoribosyltransferase [Nitrospinae bacterium]|nr:nicotinate phosphoribosyltransferase [Nitrospinota bacterium]